MMRGTFANIRIRNRMLDDVEGGFTRYAPTGETLPIYDAAMRYKADGTPLVVIAGKEYGTGSSRDWAAKGTVLLGVRAVIAESFERIHRSNLVGMGVLPLQFHDGETRRQPRPRRHRDASPSPASPASSRARTSRSTVTEADGTTRSFTARCRIDTYQRARIFPRRRHPALRAAEARGLMADVPSWSRAAIAGGRRSGCRASPITSITAIAACARRPAGGASIIASDELVIDGRVRRLCPRAISDGRLICRMLRCATLRHRDALGAADASRRTSGWGSMRGWSIRRCSKASKSAQVDGASWDE